MTKNKRCFICNVNFLPRGQSTIFCLTCAIHLRDFAGRDRNREIVRMRDDFTCLLCLRKWSVGQRRFDIHHLFGQCGLKSRGYDSIKDIYQMITLCHKCHINLEEVRIKIMEKSSRRKNKPHVTRQLLTLFENNGTKTTNR